LTLSYRSLLYYTGISFNYRHFSLTGIHLYTVQRTGIDKPLMRDLLGTVRVINYIIIFIGSHRPYYVAWSVGRLSHY